LTIFQGGFRPCGRAQNDNIECFPVLYFRTDRNSLASINTYLMVLKKFGDSEWMYTECIEIFVPSFYVLNPNSIFSTKKLKFKKHSSNREVVSSEKADSKGL
jgi:hypothetical protein